MKDSPGGIEDEKDIFVNLHDVWVAYDGKWILKSIYLRCYAGEIFGIVGPNGGGKTTLLNVILGLVRPEKGTVQLFGRNPDKHSSHEDAYMAIREAFSIAERELKSYHEKRRSHH